MDALLEHYTRSGKANREYITRALTQYQLVAGATECVSHIHEAGIETALISGSIDIVTNHVATQLGMPNVFACTQLVFDEHDALVRIEHSGDEHIAKTAYLKRLMKERGVAPHECVCIGDGANDREMFELTGHGITFPNSPLAPVAWKVVNSLVEIPPLILSEAGA